ncbi:MAG: hypothetical protein ACK4GN_14485 [Runella sp.]
MKRIRLEDIPKKEVFETPNGYFEYLPAKIQQQIQARQEEREHRFTVSWSWKRTALASVAASIVAVLTWITFPQKQTSISEDALSHITHEEVVQYLKEKQITQHEIIQYAGPEIIETDDEVLIHQLQINDEDIRKSLQEENLRGNI